VLIAIISNVYALDCQYQVNNPFWKEDINFYENGTRLNYDVLTVSEIHPGWKSMFGNGNLNFRLNNHYLSEVNVTVNYITAGQLYSQNVVIVSKGYVTITGPTEHFDESLISGFIIHSPTGLEAKKENLSFDNYTCRMCPSAGNFTCLNDGQNCTDSLQCGGNNCIRGLCSNSKVCFNNDCKCSSDEIQCTDNTRCVKKNSVQLGFKPICNIQECITGYTNKNGACALKNGEPCSISDDCVSGICNIAGFCGNEKVVPCEPYGKLNCNNQSCLAPSTKNISEAYTCEFECKTKRGDGNVCIIALEDEIFRERTKIYFRNGLIAFCAVIILIISMKFAILPYVRRRKEEEEKREKAEEDFEQITEEIRKLNEDKERLENSISNLNKENEKLNDEKKRLNSELIKAEEDFDEGLAELKRREQAQIRELNEKKIGASKEAEERIKKEVEKRRQNYQEKIKELEESYNNQKKRIDSKIKENTIRSQKIDGDIRALELKEEELEHRERKFNENNEVYWKNKALEDSMQKNNLIFNEKGYLVFKDNPNNYYHVWKYMDYLKKRGEKLPSNVSIHHIDRNKYNNALWNLIPIESKVHDIRNGESKFGKFNHNVIETYNWKSGIRELSKQLNMKFKDFPKHIQEEIKKRGLKI